MKVCIGITTKNRMDIVPKAIESALSQSYENKVIAVFNDGSTDQTAALKELFPTVIWKDISESIGLLEARNHLMRSSDADIFVSLDDDAWFLSHDEVEIIVKYFQQNSLLAGIGLDILEEDSSRNQIYPRSSPVPTNYYKGAGHALRLSAVQEAGFYVPFPIFYGHEEKDLSIRLLDLGYEIIFLPGVHVWHDYTKINRDLSAQSLGFVVNDLIYKYRRVPVVFLIPILMKSIVRTLKNRVRAGVDGKQAVKLFFKSIPKQRKYIQRVKIKTYRKYRKLSLSYFRYLQLNG